MKFSIIGFTIATACIFGMATAEEVVNDVVYNRNMPKNTKVYDFGMSGFLKKRKESRLFDKNIQKRNSPVATAVVKRNNKRVNVAEKRSNKDKRAAKYANAGTATFFSPNLGSCGWKNSPSDLIVAVNAKDMKNQKGKSNKNPLCGKMVEIVNPSGTKIRAKIVDTVS